MTPANSFQHPRLGELVERLREPRQFLQVLLGPRQVGKTTLARQALEALDIPSIYASADGPLIEDQVWIEQQWDRGRLRARDEGPTLLVLDEIQKIEGWSEIVKRLWDEDSIEGRPLQVLLLGSSPLLVERGLGESLAGRFEVSRLGHWSFAEMRDAFGWDVEQSIYYGGYPGTAPLVDAPDRFRRYILDGLIEPVIGRDILLRTRVDKPALLRRLFQLGCEYSGQILSYQAMLGQLRDAGNTTTLAHYLDLLSGAGVLAGLQKAAQKPVRRRGSSPKLLVLNTALLTAAVAPPFEVTRSDPVRWGRLVETAVGAHLVNTAAGTPVEVLYWRNRDQEVDFALRRHDEWIAVEVKAGARREPMPGLLEFARRFAPKRQLLVGTGGIPLDEFLVRPATDWF